MKLNLNTTKFMKNKMYKKNNFLKTFFSLTFGLSTVLLFGQPDPPPSEVPLDGNISVMLIIAALFSVYVFVRNYKTILKQK